MKLRDPKLTATDRVLQRWAVSIGSGLPTEEWNDVLKSRPPPLPDDIAIEVDRIVCNSPDRWRRLLRSWYCTPRPTEAIAKEMRCSRSHVSNLWHYALEDMRVQFVEKRVIVRLYGDSQIA